MGQLVTGLGGVRQVMGMRLRLLAGGGQTSPSGGSFLTARACADPACLDLPVGCPRGSERLGET